MNNASKSDCSVSTNAEAEQETLKLPYRPLLIGGMHRSGTSLMRQLLGSHSDIAIPPSEFNFFERAYRADPLNTKESFLNAVEHCLNLRKIARWELDSERLLEEAKTVPPSWRNLFTLFIDQYRRGLGKKIGGEKSPHYEYHYELLRSWFAESGLTVVQMVRHPVDNYSSYVRMGGGKAGPERLQAVAKWCQKWCRSVRLGLRYSIMFPDEYVMIRYEDLIAEPGASLQRACNVVGVSAQLERMLDMRDFDDQFSDNSSFGESSSDGEYRGKIRIRDSVDRSQSLGTKEVRILTETCGPTAFLAGYDLHRNSGDAARGFSHSDFDVDLKAHLDRMTFGEYMRKVTLRYSWRRMRRRVVRLFT